MGSILIDKRLIDAVRAEQCLYDSTTRDYRDMEERNAAWMRVASVIGISDASYCKKRFRIIRDRYVKRKRLHAQHGSKAFWDCEEMLSFLDGKITARSAKSSSRKRSGISVEKKFKFKKEEEDDDLTETFNNNLSEFGGEDYLLEPIVEHQAQDMKAYHDPLLHFAHGTSDPDNINNETVDFNSSSKDIVVHQTMDEIDYFTAMMATKLRKLPDKKCSEAKLNIMKILHDIEFDS